MKKPRTDGDVEALAARLAQHPDYRVLKRLDTSIEYPALTGADVSKASILDTETTGMEFGTDKLVELGLVVFEYARDSGTIGRVLGTYDALEDPGIGSPFETKDILKARQYRWDVDVRSWWRELDADALEAELAWLKTAVFAGRAASIDIDTLDARVRYSARAGKRERRTL